MSVSAVPSRLSSAVGVAALALCVAVSACDPCSGVASCATSESHPYLAIDGQVVDPELGNGVDGIRIDVVRRTGVAVEQDSLSTTTANGGHWRVEFQPTATGSLEADVTVSQPSGATYRVGGVHLVTSPRGGDANLLARWVSRPYFADVGELFVRGSADTRLANLSVDFIRRSGLRLLGASVADGVYRSGTDKFGRLPLFSADGGVVTTDSLGSVTGDLIVRRSATDSSIINDVTVRSTYLYRAPPGVIRVPVGPSLEYQGEFYNRATITPQGGVLVSFEQTGGVPVDVPSFRTTSLPNGRIGFPLKPSRAGVVEGRVIFQSPTPSRPETLAVKLPTFESSESRLLFYVGAGAYLPYYGLILRNGVGFDGVNVDVTRVGGIDVAPRTYTTVSAGGGIFRINPVPQALGDVTVDITFRAPAPYTIPPLRGVRLSTADRTVPDRSIGTLEATATP